MADRMDRANRLGFRASSAAGGGMYLKNVGLKTFRSFDQGEIELQRDLTVFVGENNGGKSNGIDAIRLLTPANRWPTRDLLRGDRCPVSEHEQAL